MRDILPEPVRQKLLPSPNFMHHRLPSFLFACAFLAVAAMRSQAPTTQMPAGLVLVAKVTGTVTLTVAGSTAPLHIRDQVPQTATINTGIDSTAVLVFSNGATLQLGADSELVLQGFLQEPFPPAIQVAQSKEEPSTSRTTLVLNRGEVVGRAKMLKIEKGSSFIVQTPVGAIGILGGTFRTVFRAMGVGQGIFSLSAVDCAVRFAQPIGLGIASGAGNTVVVPPGQEIKITVATTANAQGQRVVSPLPNAAPAFPPPDQEQIIPSAVATPRK